MKVSFHNLIDNVISAFDKDKDMITKSSTNPLYVLDVMRHLNIDRKIHISESVMDSNKLLGLVLDEIVKGDILDQLVLDESLVKGWKSKEDVEQSFRLVKGLVREGKADSSVLQKAQDTIDELSEVQRLVRDSEGNVSLKSFFINDLNKAFSEQKNAELSLKKGNEVLVYWVGNYTNSAYICKGTVDRVGEDWIDVKLSEDLAKGDTSNDFVYKAQHVIHIPRIHNAAWSEDWRMKLLK